MKKALNVIALMTMALVWCSCSDEGEDSGKIACEGNYTKCENGRVSRCINGVLMTNECSGSYACQNNQCLPIQSQQCGDDFVKCENGVLSICQFHTLTETPCTGDKTCQNNKCVSGSQVSCVVETYTASCEDASTRLSCDNGYVKRETCANGCANGICQQNAGPSFCGNDKIDGNELCDNFDVGSATCADLEEFKDIPAGKLITGRVKCNDSCDGIVNYDCEITTCGDGILQNGELCDTNLVTGLPMHSTFPSCDEYFDASSRGLTWKPGGEPSCSRDCKQYGKGTCAFADQPRDGIQTCEFVSLETTTFEGDDNVWLKGVIHVTTDETIDELVGRVRCGHREIPTYNWGHTSDLTQYVIVDGAESATGDHTMEAYLKANNWGPGTYDCVFQVNGHGGNDSYYTCPIQMGYPSDEGIVDDTKYRSYVVEQEHVDGDVIAYWGFNTLGAKNAVVSRAKADSGADPDAVVTITAGSDGKTEMLLVSGRSGDYATDMAISSDHWSEATSVSAASKHYSVKFSTNGYQNIRVQMYVAMSSTSSGNLSATMTIGNETKTADNYTMKNTDRSWEPWSFYLNSAENADVTLNLYTYAATKDVNARFRIDDLYILGDKIE